MEEHENHKGESIVIAFFIIVAIAAVLWGVALFIGKLIENLN